MSEVIVVTSGKGGVGKTTTTANVGTGLAAMGKRVVLIDTDIGLRNLDVVMGLENRIVYNLVDVVEGNCRVKQALIKDKRYSGLYLLASAQTRDLKTPSQVRTERLWSQRRRYPPSGMRTGSSASWRHMNLHASIWSSTGCVMIWSGAAT